ncbi:acyl-CoA dehydrogenase [Salinibacterium sp. dk2585]|uniref:acyl-CoA dehydrogenase family protein n=1 Tax=unclassified Salinibacterium TaxID=2632331 RepID=UPI0011C24CAE|nr:MULTISPECIES: acyl-CoA dehydrogenase family protein [unclassified Salinibacterium]QEE60430.1 acyl-CoA dehydrogenase [Salinibacterium sp. dk2585]TXK55503.1 acyl-CoA dehydrogenase [Salinibacterium sp. dk5596]
MADRIESSAFSLTEEQIAIREAIDDLCEPFGNEYWARHDAASTYPEEFVDAVYEAGWMSMLVPEEYGGGGADIRDAAVVLEQMERNGCHAGAVRAGMYTMGSILRHGSEEQKAEFLPKIASGELRLQSFGVTEPDAGSDTTRIKTFAVRDGDEYVVNGNKIFISRVQHSDLLLLLTRTTKREDATKPSDGFTVLLVDLREAIENGQIVATPIKTMVNHETNELAIRDLRVPVANRIGEEGKGFKVILSGMNSERVIVTSEYIGAGFYLLDRAVQYANEREVFGRKIGMNQAIQIPIARAYAQLQAASLMRWRAAEMYAAGENPRFEVNGAKLLASEALWAAAEAAFDTFGGYAAAEEYGIERHWREARLPRTAPISNNIVLAGIAHGTLGLPKSF